MFNWLFKTLDPDSAMDKKYREFMDEYHKKHALCPHCYSRSGLRTLVGYIADMNNLSAYKDLNRCECGCGSVHTVDERLPEDMEIPVYSASDTSKEMVVPVVVYQNGSPEEDERVKSVINRYADVQKGEHVSKYYTQIRFSDLSGEIGSHVEN